MSNAETSAEFASDLYSHLDSSGGDYNDILEQLGNCDGEAVDEITANVETADDLLTEAFELLDEVILEATEYEGSHGRFTDDVEAEVREVADLLEGAANAIEDALEESQSLDDSDVAESFKFGVHTDPESAFKYLYGDVQNMKSLAFEMERNY